MFTIFIVEDESTITTSMILSLAITLCSSQELMVMIYDALKSVSEKYIKANLVARIEFQKKHCG